MVLIWDSAWYFSQKREKKLHHDGLIVYFTFILAKNLSIIDNLIFMEAEMRLEFPRISFQDSFWK